MNIFNRMSHIGSSGKWSDKVIIGEKKTAEHFVYLNNHKQIYNNEQQFSISCMGLYSLECTREEYKGNTIVSLEMSDESYIIQNYCLLQGE